MSENKAYFKIFFSVLFFFAIYLTTLNYNIFGVNFEQYLAAFGMTTAVLPNPDNTLHKDLIKKEKELDAKEIILKEKEDQFNNSTSSVRRSHSFVLTLLTIISCLFVFHLFTEDKIKN
jgi:hypothetical protein